jgi:phage-related protein (TIGR01555 family)
MIGNNKLQNNKFSKKQEINDKHFANSNNINNSLNDLTQALSVASMQFGQETLSGMDTIAKNVKTALISNNRSLLTFMYTTFGIVQNGIDMPVDDAFRGKPKILAGQTDSNDIDKVYSWMAEKNVMTIFANAIKWTRLYGGGGIVIDTGSDAFNAEKPFNVYNLKIGDDIDFRDADLWELAMANVNQYAEEKPYIKPIQNEHPFNYYGTKLHKSRVLTMLGKRAPSQQNTQLRGWGLSELEKIIRVLNPLLKYETGIFELIDEVKIDVYKIKDYATQLMSPNGVSKIMTALTTMNRNKNYLNAITLDSEDSFEQKQVNLSGLAEIMREIRVGMASIWKIPMSKLYGQAKSGLGSEVGDDIENYILMIEGEIRNRYNHILIEIIKIGFQVCCGKIPEEIAIEWPPLKVLNAAEEQNIKKIKFDMLLQATQAGIIDSKEFIKQANVENLFGSEIKEDNADLFEKIIPVQDVKEKQNNIIQSVKSLQNKKKSIIDKIFNFVNK